MRKQSIQSKTGVARKRASILTAAFVTALLAVIAVLTFQYEAPYKPPAFEAKAVGGLPNPPASFAYNTIDAAGMFKFMLAGTMYQQQDGSLRIYFTNSEENEAYLLCEVTDPKSKTLYKSGLLRPGEYVESLKPVKQLENEAMPILVNIYAFEPGSFYSIGTVTLNTILQPY